MEYLLVGICELSRWDAGGFRGVLRLNFWLVNRFSVLIHDFALRRIAEYKIYHSLPPLYRNFHARENLF
jgi:hypothetical protein